MREFYVVETMSFPTLDALYPEPYFGTGLLLRNILTC